MSAANDRQEIAEAASNVSGISCTPYHRVSTKPGDALVVLAMTARDESGLGHMNTWQVVVMLPQDIAAAEAFADDKTDDLVEALDEVMVVTSAFPGSITTDQGHVPALVIEGTRAR